MFQNGNINWQKVKNSGIDFAMIREGYGKKSHSQIDKKFKDNVYGAKNSGINIGVYHYSYADSVDDAKREAEFCIENIRGIQLEYLVCFDIEDKEILKLSNRERTDIVKTFCSEIENSGYYAMFYCNSNWLNNYLIKEELLQKYDFWIAEWNISKSSFSCGIWQYSSTGKIEGINGFSKINNFKNANYFIYTVKKGDTLWAIAQHYLGNGYKYKNIKNLNALNSDMIYSGQILKIPK